MQKINKVKKVDTKLRIAIDMVCVYIYSVLIIDRRSYSNLNFIFTPAHNTLTSVFESYSINFYWKSCKYNTSLQISILVLVLITCAY